MLIEPIKWTWYRFRPVEGWLPVLLILLIIGLLIFQVAEARWAPEGSAVWITLLGSLLALILSQRPLGWMAAWLILLSYGLVLTTIVLARLMPPLNLILTGWGPTASYIRQGWALFFNRTWGWLLAVSDGRSSRETIVFTMGLVLLLWIVAAFFAWSTFKQRRPLTGLAVIALAFGLNGYYSGSTLWPIAIFVGLAALLAASVHMVDLESRWESGGIDYSTEIRLDLLLNSAAIAAVLLLLAYFIPAANWSALSRAVLDQPAVHQAEDTLGRAFAGVRQPRPLPSGVDPQSGAGFSSGAWPRGYLLGDPPALRENVVMTATVSGAIPAPTHWRGISYDIYTGWGWAVSAEAEQPLAADQPLIASAGRELVNLDQTVERVLQGATTGYTLGLPRQFDRQATAYWRESLDLSRVRVVSPDYSAQSTAIVATPDQLRQAALADLPLAILARYTALPETLPGRVRDLAQEVVAASPQATSPYDRAKALEYFLRQYPYSLDIPGPPPGADPVDYFLFDLQTGYCDYYASAMTVMARSLGLPARLAAGFTVQPTDEDGRQTIYEINGHSWAEIYFAGFGWVEFEPTATFPVAGGDDLPPAPGNAGQEEPATAFTSPPIPQKQPYRWLLLLLLLPLFFLLVVWRRRSSHHHRSPKPQSGILWAYGRLLHSARRLGQDSPVSQTPDEFESAFLARLDELGNLPLARRLAPAQLQPAIKKLRQSFVAFQYSRQKPPAEPAQASWKKIRGRLWLLSLLEKIDRRLSRRDRA